jgi:hypothetical protein
MNDDDDSVCCRFDYQSVKNYPLINFSFFLLLPISFFLGESATRTANQPRPGTRFANASARERSRFAGGPLYRVKSSSSWFAYLAFFSLPASNIVLSI